MANLRGGLRGTDVRKKFIMGGSALVLLTIVGMVLYTFMTLSWSYSDGDRSGVLQKFSRKGWICRTWEGELAMTPVPGAVPQLFYFTVRDDVLAKQIAVLEGKKVALHYKEKKGVPSSCFGDTHYFISDVRALAP